jgi:hypothetical protein
MRRMRVVYNMIRGYALPLARAVYGGSVDVVRTDTRCARDCHRESSMTSLPADGDSSGRAVRSLVDAFLAEDPQWQQWKGDAATLLDVGDQEDHLVVAVRKGIVTFETISRDHRHLSAEFGRELDAWRFLIMQLGDSWRSDRQMRDINPRKMGLAPGTTLERGPSGYWLPWPGGAAIFHSDLDAIGFSWVARAEPADIAASYRHFNGEPLFDLGLPVEAQWPAPPAPRRVMAPPPVEKPQDDLDAADLAVIDAVAAVLKWARRPATGAEILSVGDDQVGRAISYRQSQFVYEHTVGRDWRKIECTFSTAAGARRFLIAELGSILRMRTRMRTIRPKLAAPDCHIERGPASFLVTSPAGQAAFRLGLGHGHALVFSWVATASLTSIAASYRDPDGRPVFSPSCLLPSPYERPPPRTNGHHPVRTPPNRRRPRRTPPAWSFRTTTRTWRATWWSSTTSSPSTRCGPAASASTPLFSTSRPSAPSGCWPALTAATPSRTGEAATSSAPSRRRVGLVATRSWSWADCGVSRTDSNRSGPSIPLRAAGC